MRRLSEAVYPSVRDLTFFESCGVADLIATCYGGCACSGLPALLLPCRAVQEHIYWTFFSQHMFVLLQTEPEGCGGLRSELHGGQTQDL